MVVSTIPKEAKGLMMNSDCLRAQREKEREEKRLGSVVEVEKQGMGQYVWEAREDGSMVRVLRTQQTEERRTRAKEEKQAEGRGEERADMAERAEVRRAKGWREQQLEQQEGLGDYDKERTVDDDGEDEKGKENEHRENEEWAEGEAGKAGSSGRKGSDFNPLRKLDFNRHDHDVEFCEFVQCLGGGGRGLPVIYHPRHGRGCQCDVHSLRGGRSYSQPTLAEQRSEEQRQKGSSSEILTMENIRGQLHLTWGGALSHGGRLGGKCLQIAYAKEGSGSGGVSALYSVTCARCRKETAVAHCLECAQDLCTKCDKRIHDRYQIKGKTKTRYHGGDHARVPISAANRCICAVGVGLHAKATRCQSKAIESHVKRTSSPSECVMSVYCIPSECVFTLGNHEDLGLMVLEARSAQERAQLVRCFRRLFREVCHTDTHGHRMNKKWAVGGGDGSRSPQRKRSVSPTRRTKSTAGSNGDSELVWLAQVSRQFVGGRPSFMLPSSRAQPGRVCSGLIGPTEFSYEPSFAKVPSSARFSADERGIIALQANAEARELQEKDDAAADKRANDPDSLAEARGAVAAARRRRREAAEIKAAKEQRHLSRYLGDEGSYRFHHF
jgi:hypothetical protein